MGKHRIVVGISGATGVIYALRLLEILQRTPQAESHLVMTRAAKMTLALEAPEWSLQQVEALADVVYKDSDVSAAIASGSFPSQAMVIVPCSMKTVAAVAHGFGDNLLARAADVMLKERRRLIVVPREAPLHQVHLRNMATISEMGGIILPPFPAFYQRPQTVADIIDHTVGKILDLLGIEQDLVKPWLGPSQQVAQRVPRSAGSPISGEEDIHES
jgi:4-hydroxy-3-polyprenylbenzoate decarboxylase